MNGSEKMPAKVCAQTQCISTLIKHSKYVDVSELEMRAELAAA